MKIVKHSDILSLNLSPRMFLTWVEQVFLELYKSSIPPKISIPLPDNGFSNTMPTYLPEHNLMGVKVVNRYLANTPSLDATMLLYDSTTGDLKALMDASYITTMRTGAVAAMSILKLKPKKESYTMGIMGLGLTARASLLCFLESGVEEEYNIKLLRYKDQAERFIDRFKSYPQVRFQIVDSPKELITDSDIILSCVTYTDGLFGECEWFKKGVLVVPVHTRGFQNCDLFFEKVYADLESQVCHFKNFAEFKKFNELSRVLLAQDPGRENNNERILAYNIGIAASDIFIGGKIYDILKDSPDNEVEFKETLDKYYI